MESDSKPPDYIPPSWYYHGRIVLDPNNNPVRKWKEIPLVLSSEYEGFDMETIRRLNTNITLRDFRARMPRFITKGTSPTLLDVYGTSTIGMRITRFRSFACCLAWTDRDSSDEMKKYVDTVLPPACKAANSTEGFRDLTGWEVEKTKEPKKGKFLSRAGHRALDPDERQARWEADERRIAKLKIEHDIIVAKYEENLPQQPVAKRRRQKRALDQLASSNMENDEEDTRPRKRRYRKRRPPSTSPPPATNIDLLHLENYNNQQSLNRQQIMPAGPVAGNFTYPAGYEFLNIQNFGRYQEPRTSSNRIPGTNEFYVEEPPSVVNGATADNFSNLQNLGRYQEPRTSSNRIPGTNEFYVEEPPSVVNRATADDFLSPEDFGYYQEPTASNRIPRGSNGFSHGQGPPTHLKKVAERWDDFGFRLEPQQNSNRAAGSDVPVSNPELLSGNGQISMNLLLQNVGPLIGSSYAPDLGAPATVNEAPQANPELNFDLDFLDDAIPDFDFPVAPSTYEHTQTSETQQASPDLNSGLDFLDDPIPDFDFPVAEDTSSTNRPAPVNETQQASPDFNYGLEFLDNSASLMKEEASSTGVPITTNEVQQASPELNIDFGFLNDLVPNIDISAAENAPGSPSYPSRDPAPPQNTMPDINDSLPPQGPCEPDDVESSTTQPTSNQQRSSSGFPLPPVIEHDLRFVNPQNQAEQAAIQRALEYTREDYRFYNRRYPSPTNPRQSYADQYDAIMEEFCDNWLAGGETPQLLCVQPFTDSFDNWIAPPPEALHGTNL